VRSNLPAMSVITKAQKCLIPHVGRETDPPEAAEAISLPYQPVLQVTFFTWGHSDYLFPRLIDVAYVK
jgi:hypothetical protein